MEKNSSNPRPTESSIKSPLAVSVREFGIFLRNQFSLIFCTMVRKSEYFKIDGGLFSGKSIFARFGQKGSIVASKQVFRYFLKNFVISFSWKQSKMKTNLLLIFHHQFHFWQKFWFLSYGPKCCFLIKLHESLNKYLKKEFTGKQLCQSHFFSKVAGHSLQLY